MKDIDENPHLPWEYSQIGCNPNVTMEMLDRYRSLIDTYIIHWNKRITIEYVKGNPPPPANGFHWEFRIDFFRLLKYNDILYFSNDSGFSYLIYHFDSICSYSQLSFDEAVELSNLYPEIKKYHLYYHEDITEEYIRNNIDPLYFGILSETIKNIDTVVVNNPDLPWSYHCLSSNKYLTIKNVIDIGIDKNWDWPELSIRLPLEDISATDYLPWKFVNFPLWARSDLTMDFILRYHHLITFKRISIEVNDSISLEEVIKYPEIPWNYSELVCHKDITLEFYEKYIDKILN